MGGSQARGEGHPLEVSGNLKWVACGANGGCAVAVKISSFGSYAFFVASPEGPVPVSVNEGVRGAVGGLKWAWRAVKVRNKTTI